MRIMYLYAENYITIFTFTDQLDVCSTYVCWQC